NWVRSLSPDVAAVVAALPRRPGSTASLAEIGRLSGPEMRALGRAVARGRDAGVLQVQGDRIGLDPDGPREAVAALVALTPLGRLLADRPELAAAAPFGSLHGVPTGELADDLLAALAVELPAGDLNEASVTDALSLFGDDPVGL